MNKTDKKERIFLSAMKLFITNGFDKTPTSLIASEAGIATGTLFHYFKTKEALINSLYLRCKDSMVSRMMLGVENNKTYKSKMKAIYINLLRWGIENREEFLFFQQFSNSPYIHEITHREGMNKFNSLVDLLDEGICNEIIRKIEIDYLITVVAGLLNANIHYFIENPSFIDDMEFVDKTFDFLWNSIKN